MPTPTLEQIKGLPLAKTGWLQHAKLNDYQKAAGQVAPSGQNWTFDAAGNPTLQKNDSILKTMILPAALSIGGAFAAPALAGALGGGGGAATAGASRVAGASGFLAPSAAGGGIMSTLSKYGPMLGRIGEVASGAAKGRADGRMAEAQYGLQRDQLGMQQAQGNAAMDSTRLRQAILLSLLSGGQDASVTPPPHIAARMPQVSGGVRPSAIANREQFEPIRERIMAALFSGQHLPGLSDAPKSNAFDSILSGLGLGTGLLGAIRPPQTGQRTR